MKINGEINLKKIKLLEGIVLHKGEILFYLHIQNLF